MHSNLSGSNLPDQRRMTENVEMKDRGKSKERHNKFLIFLQNLSMCLKATIILKC